MNRTWAGLGEVAEFVNGFAFEPADWGATGRQIIRIQNLTTPDKPYNRTTCVIAPKYLVQPGDLLVSWSASLGVFRWTGTEEAWVNQHIFKVVPDRSRVDGEYLRHALILALNRMASFLHGSTMQHVNRTEFLETKIPLPTLQEQRRVAAILDNADGIRRKRSDSLALINALLESLFLDMFGTPVTNPKEWPIHRLGEHISFTTSGSRGWAQYYAASGTRFIRSLDVQMNRISDHEAVYVNAPRGAEADRTRVQPGDVLLTITGSRIGRVSAVLADVGEAYVSQHVAIIRLNGGLRPRFVSMFLSLPSGGQAQIASAQYGQTKPGLNLEQIRCFRIPCPPIEVQDRFLEMWDKLEITAGHQQEALDAAEGLFNSLVQRAFSGDLIPDHTKAAHPAL